MSTPTFRSLACGNRRQSCAAWAPALMNASTRGWATRSTPTNCRPQTRSSWVKRVRAQQGLDRATLVHRAIALSDLIQRQHEIEHLSRTDRSRDNEIDEVRQISPNGRRTSEQ